MRRGVVRYSENKAGIVEETDTGYRFTYDADYLRSENVNPVSLTLPLRTEPFNSPYLFAFFEGLIAEGSLREMQSQQFRIDPEDSFGLLLKSAGSDVIGCVQVAPLDEDR